MADTDDFKHYPARRGIGRRRVDRQRLNWSAVTIVVTISLWLLGGVFGWFGANADEVKRISERLATLEAQRTQDVRQNEIDRASDRQWKNRMEDKIDRVLERVK